MRRKCENEVLQGLTNHVVSIRRNLTSAFARQTKLPAISRELAQVLEFLIHHLAKIISDWAIDPDFFLLRCVSRVEHWTESRRLLTYRYVLSRFICGGAFEQYFSLPIFLGKY